jgi:MSHA biogenesis protein MshN
MLARVYIDHGAEAKALAVMESVGPEGSDDAEFSSLLALLYQRAGRHADAVKIYERSIQLRPNDARTWLGYAISFEGTERWDAARNAYQRAKESGGLTPRLMRYADQRLAALAKH